MKNRLSLFVPFLLVTYEIATYLSNDMYLPALPTLMRDFALTSQSAQLTLTYWFLGSAIMPLFVGVLADRFGRRKILLLGGIIYILSSMICAITDQFGTFLLARTIQGGMIAFLLVPGYAFIHETYEPREAIKILAFMGGVVVLAPALGPLLGSLILLVAPWRAIFWFIVIWSCIDVVLLYWYMPESLPHEQRMPLHIKDLSKRYVNIFTNKIFLRNMAALGLLFAGFIAWISAGPLLVIKSFKYSEIAFGIAQAVIFSANILATRFVDYLSQNLGREKLIRSSLSMMFGSALFMLLAAVCFPNNLLLFLAGMTIYSFASALSFSPLNRIIIEASTEPMGARVAAFTVSLMCFASLGSSAAGFLFNGSLWSLTSIIALFMTAAWLIKWLKD